MSEKRFTLSNFASPSQLSDVCDDGGKMLNSEVVDVLNELYDENEALKKFIKDNFNEMMDSKLVIDDE